ncbi:hypothetical protein EC968_007396 [Mortierella alpina]|nr:hypothetical protein EC968_007396 [Mortierella alpina]
MARLCLLLSKAWSLQLRSALTRFVNERRGEQEFSIKSHRASPAVKHSKLQVMTDLIEQKWVSPAMKARLGTEQTIESILQERRAICKAKLEAFKRVPQGTMQKAVELYRNEHELTHDYTMGMFRKDLAFEESHSEWREVVREAFDGIWAHAITPENGSLPLEQARTSQAPGMESSAQESSEGTLLDQESDASKEELRTCSTSLKHVLRKELIPQSDSIIARLDDCQQTMNEITVEMSIVAQKAALLVAEGRLNEVMGFPAPSSAQFDIKTILPANFTFRADISPIVYAAPIPSGMQERLQNGPKTASTPVQHDLIRLFSPDCMRYLYTAFLGPRGLNKNDGIHPLWDALITAIDSSSVAPTLSSSPTSVACTIAEHLTQLSTALTNMWEGSVYDKSLGYTLRILLRLHLAPARERKTKERIKAAALKKAKKVKEPRKTSHGLWLLKLRLLCDEVADALSKPCPNEHRLAEIGSRLRTLQHEEQVPVIKQLPPLEEQLREMTARVTDQGPADCNEDTGLACNTILAVDDPDQLLGEAEDDDDEEKDDDDNDENEAKEGETATVGEADHCQKESSRQRLKGLQAVLKMLLESPSIQETINCKWVRESGFAKEDFTDRECEVVAFLANTLRPYVPKVKHDDQGRTMQPPAHVAMRASFVSIANSIVRAAGYPEFARRISPQVSAGTTQALHLG